MFHITVDIGINTVDVYSIKYLGNVLMTNSTEYQVRGQRHAAM